MPYEAATIVEEKRDGAYLCSGNQSDEPCAASGLALWSNLDRVSEERISRATKVYCQLAWLESK